MSGSARSTQQDAFLPNATEYDVLVSATQVRVQYTRDGKKVELVYARPPQR